MVSTGFSTFKPMRVNLLILTSILGVLVVLAAAEKDPSLEDQVIKLRVAFLKVRTSTGFP